MRGVNVTRSCGKRSDRRRWPRSVTAALVLALAFGFLPDAAFAERCQQVSETAYDIDVSATTPKARLDHSKSVEQIKAIAGRNILGMHRTQIRPRLDIRPEYYPVEGGYCYWIASVHLEIASESPYVLIPSEYPRNSCNYNAILKHEDKHAVTAKRVIQEFAPNFEPPLTSLSIPKHHSPIFTEDVGARYSKDIETIWNLLEPSFDSLFVFLDEEQMKVDSDAEYRRVFETCSRW